MNSLVRTFTRVLAGVGVLILLLAASLAGAIWLTLPGRQQTVQIPGLSGAVDITYDADRVPRVRAGSEQDAAAALGFLHASDRMFQMDLMRRAASGRLSEIAGPATLPIDRMMRTLGLRQHAVADLAALPADTRAVLEAYARGVNAAIDRKGRFIAPEFLVLGTPEKWEATDSLLWAKTMGLWLSMNWRQELARQALAGKVPATLLDQLWPRQPGVTAPDAMNEPLSRFALAASRLNAVLPDFPAPYTLPSSASNEWAVDGRHTATGAPLLAGDPHLAFGFPGIWYLARIDIAGAAPWTLAGATAPGVPFLVIGHNGKIGWTFTTTGADVQDIFVETAAGPGEYQTPDGPKPFVVREERIKVRGQADVVITVRETRHGPVISDLDHPDGPIMAVAMANLQPGDTAAAGLLALNRAATVQEAGAADSTISSPVQNLLVADAKTIGLFITGRVPIRKAGDGSAPVPGDGRYDWVGWASGEQLPHSISPASGRLVNANEPVWPADFPVFMGRDTFGDWRAKRIRAMLATSDRHTAAGFAAMQVDTVDGFARQVLPTLLAVKGASEQAIGLLREWDGSAVMDSPAPLIFNAWMDAFYAAVLRHAGLTSGVGAPISDFVASVLTPDGAHWCDGDCEPMLRDSLTEAMQGLSARFGNDPAAWRWGDAHQAVFAHPFLRSIPVLGSLTTISIPSPGDDNTLDRGGANAAFQSVHGAAYRGVYDLADLDRSLFMITPGQSGNPFSTHARDFAIRWRDGATIILGPVAADVTGTIRLIP